MRSGLRIFVGVKVLRISPIASKTSSATRASAFLKLVFQPQEAGLDWRLGEYFGKEEEARANLSDCPAHGLGFVRP